MQPSKTEQSEVLRILRARRQEIGDRFTVRRIGIFGSFAKGNQTPESDIDVLVELAEPTFDHYMDLKFYLEEIFDRSVDLVLAETVKPRLKPVIQQEVLYA
jgi:predicted nucleotidyltransferase